MPNIVQVHDLTKKYGDNPAVNGISFAIREGEIFGLLGPNGAGKTTTISMLSTLLAPTAGSIAVGGHDSLRDAARVKQIVGVVPQDLALYPTLSARDNLEFFGRIYGLRGRDLNARVETVLDIVGLRERGNDAVDTFSGGMKRRVNLAAGLLHKPKILFLDEPTVGVDPQSRNHIFENVERLNREGMTILYTTHYMEEAERLCHRVGIIDHGNIIALDSPKALIESLHGGMIHLGVAEGKMDALVEQARGLANVQSVRRLNGKLEVGTARAQDALVALLEVVNRLDARVTSLQVFEPNLETVFLHLTGKRLRD